MKFLFLLDWRRIFSFLSAWVSLESSAGVSCLTHAVRRDSRSSLYCSVHGLKIKHSTNLQHLMQLLYVLGLYWYWPYIICGSDITDCFLSDPGMHTNHGLFLSVFLFLSLFIFIFIFYFSFFFFFLFTFVFIFLFLGGFGFFFQFHIIFWNSWVFFCDLPLCRQKMLKGKYPIQGCLHEQTKIALSNNFLKNIIVVKVGKM